MCVYTVAIVSIHLALSYVDNHKMLAIYVKESRGSWNRGN